MKLRVAGWAVLHVALVAALVYGRYRFTRTPLRGALPWRAHVVGEWEGPSPVDYSCGIVAEISPQEFEAYVHRRGLHPEPCSDSRADSRSFCPSRYDGEGPPPRWWTPPCGGQSFVRDKPRVHEWATYQNGRLYGALYNE